MKALIIGGGGFVGKYLAEHLMQDRGWETVVTKLPKETVSVDGCEIYNLDILDQDAVEALLIRLRPDVIFHLAAQSSVAYSWKNPQLTVDINIHGSLNVLEAIRAIEDYQPKVLLIGSGEEYGALPHSFTASKIRNTSWRPGRWVQGTGGLSGSIFSPIRWARSLRLQYSSFPVRF